MSLAKLLAERKLIVCVGPGGVGKTTASAAIGLAAAQAGRKTFVLTIDPARRLADALALDGLDDTARRVPTEVLGNVPGELHAAMVETGASFDSLIERIASDAATKRKIFDNRVYQAISRSLARSHAYVAMECLYHAVHSGQYDLIILDTPPARNAIDILDAPGQLARFLDGRIVSWFLPDLDKPKGLGARLIARGGKVATQLLGRITGRELLDGILEFLEAFASLRDGFMERANAVDAMLRADSTGFVLVSSAHPAAADDAGWLRDDLARRGVAIDAAVFNQSYLALRPDDPRKIIDALPAAGPDPLASVRAQLPDADALAALATAMRSLRQAAAKDNKRFAEIVGGLVAELPSQCTVVRAPRLDQEVRDLPSLQRLAGFLV